jgi:hypothetical protein
MATIPTPTRFNRVSVDYVRARGRSESGYNFKAQNQLWSGKRYVFGLNVAPVKLANSSSWKTFLRALADGETFTLDLSAYVEAGVPQPMTLELVGNSSSWEIDIHKYVHIGLTVQEVKS